MRASLLIPVAAIPAVLVWLLGSPLLGRSNADHPAPITVRTGAPAPRPHPTAIRPDPTNAARRPTHAPVVQRPSRAGGVSVPTALVAPRAASSPAVTIVIPRLAVRVPVVDRGVDAGGNLPIANGLVVTHYSFSTGVGAVGNYVVYGHDDIQGSVFRHLDALRIGDPIELVRGSRRYLYRVTTSRVVSPTEVEVLRPTSTATMTLITCTPYMVDTQRIVVDAALEGVEGL
ncbi:MAG: sortase [Chloroflexota bacterium]